MSSLHQTTEVKKSRKPKTIKVTNLDKVNYSNGFMTKPRPYVEPKIKKVKRRKVDRKLTEQEVLYRAKQANLEKVLLAGCAIDKPANTMRGYTSMLKSVNLLIEQGIDIVTVASKRRIKGGSVDQTALWMVDSFNRIPEKMVIRWNTDTQRQQVLVSLMNDGYMVEPKHFGVAQDTINVIIRSMRNAGVDVCIVKCKYRGEDVRGYIVPCAKNKINEMAIKKASSVWELN